METLMKQITYKKRHSLKNHRKFVLINEHNDEKDYKTAVRKSFVYKIVGVEEADQESCRPEIYIRKEIDHLTKQEKFSFRVKGHFYLKQNESTLRVEFCHSLKIIIYWKTKIFSPKKSETLT